MEPRSSLKRTGLYILFFAVAFCACLAFTLKYFGQAFPYSDIEISIDGNLAEIRARSFLDRLGYDIEGYSAVVSFEKDEEVDHYLQNTIGIDRLNELTKTNEVCLHYFRVRLYKQGGEEEFIVGVSANGTIDGFRRYITDAYGGGILDEESATQIASNFLADIQEEDLALYELNSARSRMLEQRTDYAFVWVREWPYHTSTKQEIIVHVQGERVGFVEKYIKVPDSFSRSLDKESSYSSLLLEFSKFATLSLVLLALYVIIYRAVNKLYISWNYGIYIGLVTGSIAILLAVNNYPVLASRYSTNVEWWVFVTKELLFVVGGALLAGLQVLIFSVAGKPLECEQLRDPVDDSSVTDEVRRRSADCSLIKGCCSGYLLGMALLTLHVVYYVVARRFGAWFPSSPRYSTPFWLCLRVGISSER